MSKEAREYTIEEIAAHELTIDLSVQRSTLNMNKVRRFKKNFNPNALGVITVSDRGHGEKIVLDGQHRVELIRQLTDGNGQLKSKVFRGLSKIEEGDIFLQLNAGDKPSQFDRYRVGSAGSDEVFTQIDKIVHRHGFKVGNNNEDGSVNAIAVLARIYNLTYRWETEEEPADHNILDLVLGVIEDAWGNQSAGLQGAPIEAVGKMIQFYDDQLEHDRLVSVMRDYKGGPGNLVNTARAYANLKNKRIWQALVEILVEAYNKNFQSTSSRRLVSFTGR